MEQNTQETISPSYYFDYESSEIEELIAEFKDSSLSQQVILSALYLKVRDGWRYNPYRISLQKENYRASHIAKKSEGHCIEKSILLGAAYRALGIPAKLHLAKVKNHIGVERLMEKFGTNEITPHGMLDVWNGKKWVKTSPAFNVELCHKCNVAPLDFDGENDSLFQEFDNAGNQFMDYLEDYGAFEDVPLAFIKQNFLEHYPMAKEKLNADGEIFL